MSCGVLLITLHSLIQVLKLQDCGTASKDAEKLAKDLALEKDKLTQVNTKRRC
jgi:hypothetical protein